MLARGDELARGHGDTGLTRVDRLISWPVGKGGKDIVQRCNYGGAARKSAKVRDRETISGHGSQQSGVWYGSSGAGAGAGAGLNLYLVLNT